MKARILSPIQFTPILKLKPTYKVVHYVRAYPDLNHPELFTDYPVDSRTQIMDCLLIKDRIAAYQFFDTITITRGSDITISKPRNFSKLHKLSCQTQFPQKS
jgi:hypothetical protein